MSRQKGDIMRELMISIQPKWVSPITLGKKTVECRKNKPNCEVPFKCYIYCSAKDYDKVFGVDKFMHKVFLNGKGKGKVIGHFICDKIVEFPHDPYDPAFSETADLSCVGIDGLSEYLGHKDYGYGWHITDLVVYDKPRELSEFKTPDWYADCEKCNYLEKMRCPVKDSHKADVMATACRKMGKSLTRPPQSYCYIATEPRQTAD
jgi:predicted transcriptional regulator